MCVYICLSAELIKPAHSEYIILYNYVCGSCAAVGAARASVGLIHLPIDAVGIHINLHCAQVCRLAKYNIKCHKYTCYLCMSVCHMWIH